MLGGPMPKCSKAMTCARMHTLRIQVQRLYQSNNACPFGLAIPAPPGGQMLPQRTPLVESGEPPLEHSMERRELPCGNDLLYYREGVSVKPSDPPLLCRIMWGLHLTAVRASLPVAHQHPSSGFS
jgi:hypothetical protein